MSNDTMNRTFGTWDLVAFAVMTMVPIAPMGIYGVIAALGEGHVPLIYLLAAVAMSFTAWGYGQFAKRYPSSGSVYSYVGETLGSNVGFVAGWAILLDYLLIPGLVILVSALWLKQYTGISIYVWALVFIVPMTGLNILGISMTKRATQVLFVFEVVVFGIFAVVAVYKILTTPSLHFTLRPFYNPQTFSYNVILAGASVAVLSFLGFDVMTTLAEESREARKSVSRAAILVIPIIAFFFVSQTYLAEVIHPAYNFQNKDIAFYFIARQTGGHWLQLLTLAGTVAAWGFGDTLAAQAGVSRVLMAMGREGHLPSVFAKLHPEYRTPYVSILVVAVLTLGLVYVMTLQSLSSVVNFGALSAFALMNVSLAYHFVRNESRSAMAFVPTIGFLLVAAIWWGLDLLAKEIGVVWLVVGVLYLAYITNGFRKEATMPGESVEG